jgi:hypothetical protein
MDDIIKLAREAIADEKTCSDGSYRHIDDVWTREPALARWIERVAPAIERLRLAVAKDREDFATFSMDIPNAIDEILRAADGEVER